MSRREEREERRQQAKEDYPILPGMTDDEIDLQIRKRIKRWIDKRNEFMGHLISFIGVNLFLWGLWLVNSSPGNSGLPWPAFVTFFWGMGLVGHAYDTYQHSPALQSKQEETIQRAVQREKERIGLYDKPKRDLYDKPKRDPAMTVSDEGELVPDDEFSDAQREQPARRAERRNS